MNELLPLMICAGVILTILIVLIAMLAHNISKANKIKRRKQAFRDAPVREMNTTFIERYRYKNRLFFVYENDDGRLVVIVRPEQYGLNDTRDGTLYYKEFEGKKYFVNYKLGKIRYRVNKHASDELKDLFRELMGEN